MTKFLQLKDHMLADSVELPTNSLIVLLKFQSKTDLLNFSIKLSSILSLALPHTLSL